MITNPSTMRIPRTVPPATGTPSDLYSRFPIASEKARIGLLAAPLAVG
ncbi:MAG: hypothetical protein ACYC38_14395 [Eubacteriales bacterium]